MRTAGRSRLSCADVLLCHGHYHQASACYFDGIWRGRVGRCDDFSAWEDVERLALLKILYCSSASEDNATYMRAAVLLCAVSAKESKAPDPSPRVPSTPSSCPPDADTVEPVKLCIDSLGVHPFQSYFRVDADHVMTLTALADPTVDDHSHAPSSATPTPERSGFYVAPGTQYVLSLSVVSLFPCTVSVDEICATFESTAPHDSTGGICLFSAVCRPRSAECIRLIPNVHHVLSLQFTAPADSSGETHLFTCCEIRAVAGSNAGRGRENEGQFVSFVMKREPSASVGVETVERALSHSPTSISLKESDTELDRSRDEHLSSASNSQTLSLLPCIIVSHKIEPEPLIRSGVNNFNDANSRLPTIERGIEAMLSSPLLCPSPAVPLATSTSSEPQYPSCEVMEVRAEFLSQILLRNVSESARRIVGIRVINSAFKSSMSPSLTPLSTSKGVTAQCAYSVTVLHCPLCTLEGEVPLGIERRTASGADPGRESESESQPLPSLSSSTTSSVPVLLPGEAYSASLRLCLKVISAPESVRAMVKVGSAILRDPSLVIYFESGHPSPSSPVSQTEVVISLLGFIEQVAKLMVEKHGGVWEDIAADRRRSRVRELSGGTESTSRDDIQLTERSDKDIGGVTECSKSELRPESTHSLLESGVQKMFSSRSPCRALGPPQRILTKAIKSDRPALHSSSNPRGSS